MSAPPFRATRLLYWGVRREMWENRSIIIGPLAAAGLVMAAVLISARMVGETTRAIYQLDPAAQGDALAKPFIHASIPVFLTMIVVSIVYSLGALYGERRERSVLFWKSLPVSDAMTVFAKAAIPLVVLPLLTFGAILATQIVMLLLDAAVLSADGVGAGPLWAQLPFFQMQTAFLYGLAIMSVWFSPIVGWLLLVSAWARRTPFLWAVSPIALCVLEGMAFHSVHLGRALLHRLGGAGAAAFADGGHGAGLVDRLAQLDPVKFLSTPEVWIGLAVAAGFLAGAVRLRRVGAPL